MNPAVATQGLGVAENSATLYVAAMQAPAGSPDSWRQLLSPTELAYCLDLELVGEHVTARVVAKQAIAEALRWPGAVPWSDIEILRIPPGRPAVRLTGEIDEWRRQLALPVPRVSLSHAAGYATALAWLPGNNNTEDHW
jgi:phosphopantetheinyl transferase (holo-ACP synthase)